MAGKGSATHIFFGMFQVFVVKFEACIRNMASGLKLLMQFATRQPFVSRRGWVLMSISPLVLVRTLTFATCLVGMVNDKTVVTL